jgi:hypothetical protein
MSLFESGEQAQNVHSGVPLRSKRGEPFKDDESRVQAGLRGKS